MKKLKIGIIGLGQRGRGLLNVICEMTDIEILAVCDVYEDRVTALLKINRGNRMVSLVSMASKASGLHDYVSRRGGEDSPLAKVAFAQGDVVTDFTNGKWMIAEKRKLVNQYSLDL